MKRYFPKVSAFILTLAIVFAMNGFLFPQTAYAGLSDAIFGNVGEKFLDAILFIPGWAAILILKVATLIVWLSGAVLNYAVQYSVVDMKENLEKADAVNKAWRTIRDLANISFIFVLLYAAIQTILGIGKDTQKLIVRVVIVAILINFSLFFTKVVIDVSNILAITFYDAIAPGALSGDINRGLSNSLMEPLKIQSIMKATEGGFDGDRLLIIGVMGTIVTLIAAFVFFAVALMFIIRFVVLIFVLVLSPIAFVSFILPQTEKYRKDWWQALSGQAFFAPIYFMLTWIVIVISRGLLASDGDFATVFAGVGGPDGGVLAPPRSSVAILVNFIIMIALLIISLVVAKEWANKAPGGINKLTSWATGRAGDATLGFAGWAGRRTVGAGASRLAQSESFQRFAGRNPVGQFALNKTNQAAKSSFDLRATRLGGAALGQSDAGEAKQGGFEATLQKKTEAKEKFAQTLRAPARGATPSAKEAYATRISRGPVTSGGTRNSRNTIMGTLGRHNRVAASKILNGQLAPLETQEQNLQNRETQLNQQLANMTNELTTLNAIPIASRTPQQIARLAALQDITTAGVPPVPTNRNSIAYTQHQLTQTQTNLTRVTAETTRIRNIINTNQLNNPANPIVNPVTGTSRPARADEQNY